MNPRHVLAYALLGVWAALWTFFAVAAGLFQGGDPGDLVVRVFLVALIVLGIPFAARRWPQVGGCLLISDGAFLAGWVLLYLNNRPATTAFLLLALALPPLLAGLLLVLPAKDPGSTEITPRAGANPG